MTEFKYKQFKGDIMLRAIRWYLKNGISYREIKEMLKERGVNEDYTTNYR